MYNKTMFVCELPNAQQSAIKNALQNVLGNAEDMELAMNSRLCDLEDTIDIYSL